MIKYIIERSANHAHLTEADASIIFGDACLPENLILKPLAICGEFATNLKVVDGKGNSYTVVYPWRNSSQIEVAQSDYYKMFKTYASRVNSGEILDAESIVVNDAVSIPVIVVKAHIHVPPSLSYKIPNYLDFPFPLSVKINETVDGNIRMHLDIDQYAALQGTSITSYFFDEKKPEYNAFNDTWK